MFPNGVPISKRLFDLLAAGLGVILLSPLLLVLAILVRVKLGSPVFFRQQRPGYHGQPFRLYKFRSMTGARDTQGQLLPDAKRLTRLGRFLRSASLDELPELFNVLRGEMSLVGPRPLLMQYLPRYSPEQARRHAVLPGITGWAQINGRNALTWQDKFRLDVWYVDHWAFGLDIKILLLTLGKVFKREGISQPGHATAEEFMGNPPEPTPVAAPTGLAAPNPAAAEFWQAYCRQVPEIDPNTAYQVWYFGDNRALADELLCLVLAGKKTATTSLGWSNEANPEEAPLLGGYSVITDFDGAPRCILQTTEIRSMPYDQVDPQFAADEGEGDLSLEYWRQAHWSFFSRCCAELGRQPVFDMPVVCERFRLVYPAR
jgi:sugar transferase EpsL